MTDRIIRIFLVFSCLMLAISLINRPHPRRSVLVSDNGIVPPNLLKAIAKEDEVFGRPVDGLKLDDSQLNLALESLADAAKIKIDVNWKALEGAGIDPNAPVHVHSRHGTLRQALNWIADSVGGRTTRLGYALDGDAIVFSTSEDLSRELATEIYNIRPLIAEILNATPRPANGPGTTYGEAVEQIARLLMDNVEAAGWREGAGGVSGSIREADGLLIVIESRQSQREIATLLTRLDAAMKPGP